jgi:hypothetical protein
VPVAAVSKASVIAVYISVMISARMRTALNVPGRFMLHVPTSRHLTHPTSALKNMFAEAGGLDIQNALPA